MVLVMTDDIALAEKACGSLVVLTDSRLLFQVADAGRNISNTLGHSTMITFAISRGAAGESTGRLAQFEHAVRRFQRSGFVSVVVAGVDEITESCRSICGQV